MSSTARLAAALRPHADRENNSLTCPTVVTIASCEGGQVGTVVGAGASVAHALHEAGIPLVVGSQFPLSFAASVVMVQVLYNGLLNGSDPRRVLNDLRRQLKSRVPLTHDWASIVAYASLPENLTDELSSFRIQQAKGSIEAALDHADTLTREGLNRSYQGTGSGTGDASVPPLNATFEALEEPQRRLKRAQQRLEELLLHHSYPEEASIYGLLASTQKRLAEVLWRMAVKNTDRLMYYRPQALTALRASRDFYGKAFQADGAQSWALVQQLALIAVLQGADQISPDDWQLGRLLSLRHLTIENRERRTWAQANLIELYLWR
jgi:hypothetical protein